MGDLSTEDQMSPQENASDAADALDEIAQGQGQPPHPHSAPLRLCEEYTSGELPGTQFSGKRRNFF